MAIWARAFQLTLTVKTACTPFWAGRRFLLTPLTPFAKDCSIRYGSKLGKNGIGQRAFQQFFRKTPVFFRGRVSRAVDNARYSFAWGFRHSNRPWYHDLEDVITEGSSELLDNLLRQSSSLIVQRQKYSIVEVCFRPRFYNS